MLNFSAGSAAGAAGQSVESKNEITHTYARLDTLIQHRLEMMDNEITLGTLEEENTKPLEALKNKLVEERNNLAVVNGRNIDLDSKNRALLKACVRAAGQLHGTFSADIPDDVKEISSLIHNLWASYPPPKTQMLNKSCTLLDEIQRYFYVHQDNPKKLSFGINFLKKINPRELFPFKKFDYNLLAAQYHFKLGNLSQAEGFFLKADFLLAKLHAKNQFVAFEKVELFGDEFAKFKAHIASMAPAKPACRLGC